MGSRSGCESATRRSWRTRARTRRPLGTRPVLRRAAASRGVDMTLRCVGVRHTGATDPPHPITTRSLHITVAPVPQASWNPEQKQNCCLIARSSTGPPSTAGADRSPAATATTSSRPRSTRRAPSARPRADQITYDAVPRRGRRRHRPVAAHRSAQGLRRPLQARRRRPGRGRSRALLGHRPLSWTWTRARVRTPSTSC